MTWRLLFPPGPMRDVRAAYERWRQENQGLAIADDHIRIDLIRSLGGEIMRVFVDDAAVETDELLPADDRPSLPYQPLDGPSE